MDLPQKSYTLTSFTAKAKRLLAIDQTDFVRFMISGIHDGYQAVVDPLSHTVEEDDILRVRRDFDSMLLINRDILVKGDLTVYPVAKKEDTLTANIHINHDFVTSRGRFRAPVHKIPNLCIAKWGTHCMIRVLIPELYDDARANPMLTQQENAFFYENGLLPAMQHLDANGATEWPATYTDEMFRARSHAGHLAFQTKVMPDFLGWFLGDYIRDAFEQRGSDWHHGLVFLHQIRGVKNSCRHSPEDEVATDALELFFEKHQLDLDEIRKSDAQCWVDVGLEVMSDEYHDCLGWRTDSHFHLVHNIFRIFPNHAERITEVGSSEYCRDLTSLLPAVSGCRITPGIYSRGPHNIRYFQMYSTDKALIYRLDRGRHGKFITCSDIIKGKAGKYTDGLYSLYRNAATTCYSLARLEVRVPLSEAAGILLDLDDEFLRESLVAIPVNVYWSLRAYYALAMKFVLQWQVEGDARYQKSKSALLLTAAASWLLNGLHSTLDNGASSKELMKAILPHIDRTNANRNIIATGTALQDDGYDSHQEALLRGRDDDETVPGYPFGFIFTTAIYVGAGHPVPRFVNRRIWISNKAFLHLFGATFEQVGTEFFRAGLIQPAHPNRVPNKVQRTTAWENHGQVKPGTLFTLKGQGNRLPPPPPDDDSDISVVVIEDQAACTADAEDKLTNMWHQFLLDLTSLAPNPRQSTLPSYCKLNPQERAIVTEDTYKNRKLSDYFVDCQWKIGTDKEWETVFNRLFMKKDVKLTGKVQNFGSAQYLRMWEELKSTADEEAVEGMRSELRGRFDRLYWVIGLRFG